MVTNDMDRLEYTTLIQYYHKDITYRHTTYISIGIYDRQGLEIM